MVFKLLTPKEAANFMGISIRSFWNLKDRGLSTEVSVISDLSNRKETCYPSLPLGVCPGSSWGIIYFREGDGEAITSWPTLKIFDKVGGFTSKG